MIKKRIGSSALKGIPLSGSTTTKVDTTTFLLTHAEVAR